MIAACWLLAVTALLVSSELIAPGSAADPFFLLSAAALTGFATLLWSMVWLLIIGTTNHLLSGRVVRRSLLMLVHACLGGAASLILFLLGMAVLPNRAELSAALDYTVPVGLLFGTVGMLVLHVPSPRRIARREHSVEKAPGS